jgi:hypothetical protein
VTRDAVWLQGRDPRWLVRTATRPGGEHGEQVGGESVVASIGTSGWSYNHWTPELYSPGLPQGQRLARYAAEFPTVELNASFYRWPRPATYPCPQAARAGGLGRAHRSWLA